MNKSQSSSKKISTVLTVTTKELSNHLATEQTMTIMIIYNKMNWVNIFEKFRIK